MSQGSRSRSQKLPETTLRIEAPFKNGIRPEAFQGRNAQFLKAAQGRRCVEPGGLQPLYSTTSAAFAGAAHPYPLLAVAKRSVVSASGYPVIALGDRVAKAYDPVGAAYLSISPKDWFADHAGGTSWTIPAGKAWHFTETHGTWFAFNKTSMLFRTGWYPYVYGQSESLVNTGCFHKDGSMFFGGFDPTSGVWTAWSNFLFAYNTYTSTDVANITFGALQKNHVWITHPKGGDLMMFLDYDPFTHTLGNFMKYGTKQASHDTRWTSGNFFILDLLMRGLCGPVPMPWDGEVVRILSLGDHVVVYGTNGATALVRTGMTRPPWGIRPISGGFGDGFGVHHSDAWNTYGPAAGGDDVHIAMDSGGELWRIEASGDRVVSKRLGYSSQMAELIAAGDVVISYLPRRKEFYISSAGPTYLYNEFGLTRQPFNTSSVIQFGSKTVASLATHAASSNPYVYFETSVMSSEGRQLPDVNWVKIVGDNSSAHPWRVGVFWRNKTTEGWQFTGYKTVDGRGVANGFKVSCSEFYIRAEADADDGQTCEAVEVGISGTEKPIVASSLGAYGAQA